MSLIEINPKGAFEPLINFLCNPPWLPLFRLTMLLLFMAFSAVFLTPIALKYLSFLGSPSDPFLLWSVRGCLAFGVGALYCLAMFTIGHIRENSRIHNRLRRLSAEEKGFIYWITSGNINNDIAWPYESKVVNLYAEGILIRSADGLTNGQYSYSLTARAKKILKAKC